jgi:hypothetical protein
MTVLICAKNRTKIALLHTGSSYLFRVFCTDQQQKCYVSSNAQVFHFHSVTMLLAQYVLQPVSQKPALSLCLLGWIRNGH